MPTESEPYLDNPRPEVASAVPLTASRILDVGCWRGAFGAGLKSRGSTVWGIEQVESAASIAKTRLDKVFIGDADLLMPELKESGELFDAVTFNDVLEHLIDPWSSLRMARELLNPNGVVVASIPNIRYAHAFTAIVWNADFPYDVEGIFDRTHLRFFTFKSARRMFEESGYRVVSQVGINSSESKKLALICKMFPHRFGDTRFLQTLIVATPNG